MEQWIHRIGVRAQPLGLGMRQTPDSAWVPYQERAHGGAEVACSSKHSGRAVLGRPTAEGRAEAVRLPGRTGARSRSRGGDERWGREEEEGSNVVENN